LTAIEYAVATLAWQNRFVVAGAGNTGPIGQRVPQSFDTVFTVGGIDSRGWRFVHPHSETTITESSYGAALDFMAPGMAEVGLICQRGNCSPTSSPPCPYTMIGCFSAYRHNFLTGTSFAAPKVCGAISLVLARAIELGIDGPLQGWSLLTFDDMYEILRAGCRDQVSHVCSGCGDPDDGPGRDDYFGWGLIDIDASLQYLEDNW